MKKLKFFILFIAISLINCERDDICAETTATTPRLLIEFYDALSTDNLKNVPRLSVYGEDLVTDPTVDSDATIIYNVNANAVELPLLIGNENTETTTRFVLEKDSNLRIDDNGDSNIDIIEITYTSEFLYVSRACGYKSIFNELSVFPESDGDNWISSITIDQTTIENENTVHVRIFH